MKTHPHSRTRHGFTLVELLVVISIIMVLAALGFAAIATVNKRQKSLVTQSSVMDLYQAIDQYYHTYNRLPDVGGTDELTVDGQPGAELVKILTGKEDPGGDIQNPKGLVFLTTKIGSNKNQGGLIYSGRQVVGMFDAWGYPLHIRFDSDDDNEIPDPIRQGEIVRQKRVIIWSFGADGKAGDSDEVKSW